MLRLGTSISPKSQKTQSKSILPLCLLLCADGRHCPQVEWGCSSKRTCNTSASPSSVKRGRWGKVRSSGQELLSFGDLRAPKLRVSLAITFRTHRKHNVGHLIKPVATWAGDAGTQGERSELWGSRGASTSSSVVRSTQVDGF